MANAIDKPRKKSHCLRNCLISALVIIVLIFGAIAGGAVFAYNKFGKPILEISLGEVFGVIRGIGHYDKNKIVTNPYTDQDRVDFYANLEKATCVNLPDDFTISKAVNEVLKSQPNPDPNQGGEPMPPEPQPMPPAPQPAMATLIVPGYDMPLAPDGTIPPEGSVEPKPEGGTEPTPDTGEPKPEGGTEPTPDTGQPQPSNPLDSIKDFKTGNAYLDQVLKETYFDFSSLDGFEGGNRDLVITDKQFAAVMNEVLVNLDMPQIKDFETKAGILLKDFISVKQVTISGADSVAKAIMANEVAVPGEDAPIVNEAKKNVKISLVIHLDLKNNVPKILKSAVGSQVPEFAINLVSGMLPDDLFVGVGVYPYNSEAKPEIFVNGIQGKIMDNLLKAVNGIMKQSNPDATVDDIFAKVSNVVATTIKTMEDTVGELRFVDSSLAMDPISMLMGVLKVNVPDENGNVDHYITGSNFFKMLKHLYHTDNTIKSLNINVEEYINKNVGAENRISEAQYQADMKSIAMAYAIGDTLDISTWKPQDFMNRAGEIPSHINVVAPNAKGEYIYNVSQEELLNATVINDSSLGYMIDSMLKEGFKNGIAGLPFEISVESFVLYEPKSIPGELRVRFTAGVATSKIRQDLIDADAVLSKLITSVIPEHIYMEVELPIRKASADSHSGIVLNFLGRDDKDGVTDEEMQEGIATTKEAFGTLVRIISAIDKEMGSKMDVDALLATLDSKIHEVLLQLEGQLQGFFNGGEAQPTPTPDPSLTAFAGETTSETPIVDKLLKPGKLQLPTIYELIHVMAGNDKSVTPADIQVALQGMYTYTSAPAQSTAVLDTFIVRELEGKLFLKNDDKRINSSNIFTEIQGLGNRITTEGVGGVIDAERLITDNTHSTVESLKLSIKAEELGAIVNSIAELKTAIQSLPYDNMEVAEGTAITTDASGDSHMSIMMKLSGVKAGEVEGVHLKYANLLPAELYVKASIKLTDVLAAGDKYKSAIYINKITDSSKATLNAILSKVMKSEAGNTAFDTIEKAISDQIAAALGSFEAQATALEYKDNSIVAMSIYDVIYDQVIKEPIADVTAQDLMDILKQVLARDSAVVTNNSTPLGGLIADLENKMLLDSTKATIDENNFVGSITALSGQQIFDMLKPSILWDTPEFASVSGMDIAIKESELASIMNKELKKWKTEGLPPILGTPVLENMQVTAKSNLSMEFSVPVDKANTSPDYKQILPFMPNKLVLRMTLDMTNPTLIEATLLINDLTAVNEVKATAILNKLAGGGAGFDLNSIKDKVTTEIGNVFNTLTNVGLPLEFLPKAEVSSLGYAEGIAKTGNIFDMIIKTDETRFSGLVDSDLHSVIYKGLDPKMTANWVDGATLDNFAIDLNDKMLLADGTIKPLDMLGDISTLTGGKDIFDNINFNKLWLKRDGIDRFTTEDKMNIVIQEGEMMTIMRNRIDTIDIAGLPAIFKKPIIDNIKVGANVLDIEFKLEVDKTPTNPEYDKYKDILAFMPDKLILKSHMDVVNAANNSIYINNLTKDDDATANKVFTALGFDVKNTTAQLFDALNAMLKVMSDAGLPMTFNADGSISSGNIYDMIMKVDVAGTFSGITKQDLHSMLRALYEDVTNVKNRIIINAKNPGVEPAGGKSPIINSTGSKLTASISDYYISHYIFSGEVNDSATGNPMGTMEQMAVLAGAGLAKANETFSGFMPTTATRGLLVTVDVKTAGYVDQIGAGGVAGFNGKIPANIIATVLLDIPEGIATADDIKVIPVINGMSVKEMETFNKVLGGDKGMVSKISNTLRNELLNVNLQIGGFGITLGEILTNAEKYEDKYTGPTSGTFGNIIYSKSLI